MTFNPNIPLPTDLLSDSQLDLNQNMHALDASFLADHYTFSDLTVNNGKHRNVTTPNQITVPTSLTDSKLFGLKPTANFPVMQFSVAQSPPLPAPPYVASPVTYLQSPSIAINLGAGAVTNVLDFTSIIKAVCKLFAFNKVSLSYRLETSIFWNGATFSLLPLVSSSALQAVNSGNIIQIKNNTGIPATEVFWTLQLLRVE